MAIFRRKKTYAELETIRDKSRKIREEAERRAKIQREIKAEKSRIKKARGTSSWGERLQRLDKAIGKTLGPAKPKIKKRKKLKKQKLKQRGRRIVVYVDRPATKRRKRRKRKRTKRSRWMI